jgi:RNA polymerase sigma-70 factor (ECF subfamily)
MTEGAFKAALHRLRRRFRERVREEIAGTVDDPAQVREELRSLLEVLSKTR